MSEHEAYSELVRVVGAGDRGLVNPATGEVVGPGSTDGAIIELLAELAAAKRMVEQLQLDVGRWLIERMDTRRKWTVEAGTLTARSTSPARHYEWDTSALRTAVSAMVASGDLAQSAADACFRTKVEVAASGINAVLAGCSEEQREHLQRCRRPSSRSRRVYVAP